MNQEAQRIRERYRQSQKEFREAEESLQNLEENCRHIYGSTEDAHYVVGGYTIPGDPHGTMGVDRRVSVYVPRETKKRWMRKCTLCGKVEYTENVRTEVCEVGPIWPGDRR